MKESLQNSDVEVLEKNQAVADKVVVEKGVGEELEKFTPPEEVLAKEEKKKSLINAAKEKINAILAGGTPEKFLQKGLARLTENPRLNELVEKTEKEHPERKNKLLMALGRWQYSKWDEKKQDYVDAGVYTDYVNK